MKVKFVNTMVYARDFEKVLEWCQKALSLDKYIELKTEIQRDHLVDN